MQCGTIPDSQTQQHQCIWASTLTELCYKTHIEKTKMKVNARINIIRKLANSKCLALCYSAAEYACPVWAGSTHARKLNPALHDCCRIISGCLKPTNLNSVGPTPTGRYLPSSHQEDCCLPHGTYTPNARCQTPTIPLPTSC